MVPPPSTRRNALWSPLLAGALALGLSAQAPDAADAASVEQMAQAAGVELEPTDAYRLTLLKMKGQLGVARSLLQQRLPGADYHVGEARESLFQETEAELERRSAPFTADILKELGNAAAGDAVRALAAVEFAVTAINGSYAQTGAANSKSVLNLGEALLREAVANYSDAVSNNEVVDLPKYQSGRGLVTEAEALVRYASGIKGRPGHEELLAVVVLIRQAWPGIIPPSIVFDPLDVAGRLDEAVAAMEKLR